MVAIIKLSVDYGQELLLLLLHLHHHLLLQPHWHEHPTEGGTDGSDIADLVDISATMVWLLVALPTAYDPLQKPPHPTNKCMNKQTNT